MEKRQSEREDRPYMPADISRLEQQMLFILEIDKLKMIMRRNYLSDGSRRENDSEHSWHLAMMVTVLAEYFKGADILKTIKMVLMHDLVEIYAGDTFAYDEKGYLDKDERERKAADKLFAVLPADQEKEYKELWQEFEALETREAIFAAVVDRMEPVMLNSASGGRMWKEHKVSMDRVLARNSLVFEKAPEIIADYVRSVIRKSDENHYFHEG
jgi:putative hydrolase of HD superfamily